MGLYVEIIKLGKEDENFAYYSYQFSVPGEEYKSTSGKIRYRLKVVSGKLKIDKKMEMFILLNLLRVILALMPNVILSL